MEEDTIELVDYLRVIWKRKRLIIVGTLVCMVVAGVVSLRLPEIYRAEALISIGNTLASPPLSSPPSLVILDTPKNLVESIPIEYGLSEEEALKYSLKVEVVRGTSLMKIIMEGPDKMRVEELLKGVVNRLTDDHLRKTEGSIQPYRVLIEKLETDIKMIQKDIAQLGVRLKKVNTGKVDPVIVMMVQNNLWQRKTSLKDIQRNFLLYRSLVGSLKEYKTKEIGGVKAGKTPVKPKKKRNVLIAGVVGLMMSLFLAFFIAYLGNVREREREREKKKDDSV